MTDTIRIFLGRLELMLAVGSALAYTIACLILRFAQSRFIALRASQKSEVRSQK
jgi:hypothetical protein